VLRVQSDRLGLVRISTWRFVGPPGDIDNKVTLGGYLSYTNSASTYLQNVEWAPPCLFVISNLRRLSLYCRHYFLRHLIRRKTNLGTYHSFVNQIYGKIHIFDRASFRPVTTNTENMWFQPPVTINSSTIRVRRSYFSFFLFVRLRPWSASALRGLRDLRD